MRVINLLAALEGRSLVFSGPTAPAGGLSDAPIHLIACSSCAHEAFLVLSRHLRKSW